MNRVIKLLPENPTYVPIEADESLEIWGVIKHVIHNRVGFFMSCLALIDCNDVSL